MYDAGVKDAGGEYMQPFKQMLLPLSACLFVFLAIPHKTGWIDVGIIALAIPLAVIASVTGYGLLKRLGLTH